MGVQVALDPEKSVFVLEGKRTYKFGSSTILSYLLSSFRLPVSRVQTSYRSLSLRVLADVVREGQRLGKLGWANHGGASPLRERRSTWSWRRF